MSHTLVWISVVALAIGAAHLPAAAAATDPRLPVIRVYDTTGSTTDIRDAAIREAATIVDDAGIPVEWRDCTAAASDPRCLTPRRRTDLVVRLLPAVTPHTAVNGSALRWRTAQGERGLQLGVAVLDPVTLTGEMATVFLEQVRSVARQSGTAAADLLGRVFAHEVGHLLLHRRAHSASGLMREVWSIEELTSNRREDWRFAAADRQQLQRQFAASVAAR